MSKESSGRKLHEGQILENLERHAREKLGKFERLFNWGNMIRSMLSKLIIRIILGKN